MIIKEYTSKTGAKIRVNDQYLDDSKREAILDDLSRICTKIWIEKHMGKGAG